MYHTAFCVSSTSSDLFLSLTTLTPELIERNIRRGCEELEMEPMVVGFLFARHAGKEGPHIFPSYAHWFSSLFTSEATSLAAQKQSFVFLVSVADPSFYRLVYLFVHIFVWIVSRVHAPHPYIRQDMFTHDNDAYLYFK